MYGHCCNSGFNKLWSYEQSQITGPHLPSSKNGQRTIAAIDQKRLIMLNMKDSFTFSEQEQEDKSLNSVLVMIKKRLWTIFGHSPQAWMENFQLQMTECHLQWTKNKLLKHRFSIILNVQRLSERCVCLHWWKLKRNADRISMFSPGH